MPEISDTQVTPAQLTAALAARIRGPYADSDTAAAAEVTAEAIRYLNHAAPGAGSPSPPPSTPFGYCAASDYLLTNVFAIIALRRPPDVIRCHASAPMPHKYP